MKLLSFQLPKWATNSEQLQHIWRTEGQEIEKHTQVLDVNWDTEMDYFSIDTSTITDPLQDEPTTKRKLLRRTARFYGPVGLLSPVYLIGKLLF